MCFVTVLLTVSVLALEVSVAGFVVSTFIEVSVVLLTEVEVSAFVVSAEFPDVLLLQAARDKETAIAKRMILNGFFMALNI